MLPTYIIACEPPKLQSLRAWWQVRGLRESLAYPNREVDSQEGEQRERTGEHRHICGSKCCKEIGPTHCYVVVDSQSWLKCEAVRLSVEPFVSV